ncbi:MAG: hypothetical protein J6M47_04765 [Clostridia bacterium]|nr:hypothetical protein [Clostridia bacterium]
MRFIIGEGSFLLRQAQAWELLRLLAAAGWNNLWFQYIIINVNVQEYIGFCGDISVLCFR